MDEGKLTFEQQMQAQLADAAVTPPANVWVAIDGQLANSDLAHYKRKSQTYQWVAAACLALLALSGVYFYGAQNTESPTLATESKLNHTPVNTKAVENTSVTKTASISTESNDTQSPIKSSASENVSVTKAGSVSSDKSTDSKETKKTPTNKPTPVDDEKTEKENTLYFADGANQANRSTSFAETSQSSPHLAAAQISWIRSVQPDQKTDLENEKLDKLYGVATPNASNAKDVYQSRLWAGVSVGAGSFDPGFSTSGQANAVARNDAFVNFDQSALSASNPQEPSFSVGNSVAGGFNIGSQVSKRFVLSTGVHYSAFETGDGLATTYVNKSTNEALTVTEARNMQEFSNLNNADVSNVSVEQVNFNNEYQYVTVPLKAGLILLDNKFNITLNTGVSSNFLISAQLQSDDLSGEQNNSSAYQDVYFNFLSSVEFGYSIMDKYRLSIEPNYNQAISDFTNSTHLSQGKPTNFGVSVGVRYNF